MPSIRFQRVLLASLLCGAAATSMASEQSRARNLQLLELGGVLQQAAGSAAQRDNPGRFGEIVAGGAVNGATQGCVAAALGAAMRGEGRSGARRACKDGAAAQATAGAIDGMDVAMQEEANLRQISTLRLATERVQRENQQIQALIAAASLSLRNGQVRLSALQRAVAARQVSTAQAQQLRAREQRNVDAMRAAIARLKAARQQHGATAQRATGAAAERRQLDSAIARMDQQIGALEGQLAEFQRALAVSGA